MGKLNTSVGYRKIPLWLIDVVNVKEGPRGSRGYCRKSNQEQ
jgi:hypothetical protein